MSGMLDRQGNLRGSTSLQLRAGKVVPGKSTGATGLELFSAFSAIAEILEAAPRIRKQVRKELRTARKEALARSMEKTAE